MAPVSRASPRTSRPALVALLVLAAGGYDGLLVLDANRERDRTAADLAVLHVLLEVDRRVDDDLDHLAAVGAWDGVRELLHVPDASISTLLAVNRS